MPDTDTAPPPLTDTERDALKDRIAVVTGASRGIGYAVASLLGRCGAQVIAVARTVAGLEALDDEIRRNGGPAATLVPLDITDGPGVDRLGAAIHQRWGKLDVFVGNAAVLGQVSPLAHVKAKTWDQTIALNLTANWRLIRTLDPVLRISEAANVVLVTSPLGAAPRPFFGPYQISKAALDALAETYRLETERSKIRVATYAPGPTNTALRAKAKPGLPPESAPPPATVAPAIARLCLPA